jgi:hypothetical protein
MRKLCLLFLLCLSCGPLSAAHAGGLIGADPCQSPFAEKSSVALNDASAGETQLIAGVAGQVIYVCGFSFTLGGTTPTAQLDTGTGTACGTGTAHLTGAFTGGITSPGGYAEVSAAAGASLCVNLGGTSPTMQGLLTYVQR